MRKPDYDALWRDPKNWKWAGIYYNPQDDRIFVPKRIPWMGATINFGHKLWLLAFSPILIILVLVMVVALVKD